MSPGVRNDTLASSRRTAAAQGNWPGDGERKSADPRAAGATSPRGAQPSGRRITICQLCRRRVFQTHIGAWYHARTASEFCNWPNGAGRKAVPLEVKAAAS